MRRGAENERYCEIIQVSGGKQAQGLVIDGRAVVADEKIKGNVPQVDRVQDHVAVPARDYAETVAFGPPFPDDPQDGGIRLAPDAQGGDHHQVPTTAEKAAAPSW